MFWMPVLISVLRSVPQNSSWSKPTTHTPFRLVNLNFMPKPLSNSNPRRTKSLTFSKDYAIFDIHLYGSKGVISLSNFGFAADIKEARVCSTFGGYRELSKSKVLADNSNVSMWENLASHVIECLDNNAQISDKSSGHDGLETIKVISLLKSGACNATIT